MLSPITGVTQSRAVVRVRREPPATGASVSATKGVPGKDGLPSDGASPVITHGTSLSLPAVGSGKSKNKDAIYQGTNALSKVIVQPTKQGVRSLVYIEGKDASERYDFRFNDATSLSVLGDGSVAVWGAGTEAGVHLLGIVSKPWAKDARGKSVPTHYEVNGQTLTQIVEHKTGDYAYGIVADPEWWQIGLSIVISSAIAVAIDAIPGVGPAAGAAIGGCAYGALNAMWDGSDFWGALRGCVENGFRALLYGVAGSVIRNVLKGYRFWV